MKPGETLRKTPPRRGTPRRPPTPATGAQYSSRPAISSRSAHFPQNDHNQSLLGGITTDREGPHSQRRLPTKQHKTSFRTFPSIHTHREDCVRLTGSNRHRVNQSPIVSHPINAVCALPHSKSRLHAPQRRVAPRPVRDTRQTAEHASTQQYNA